MKRITAGTVWVASAKLYNRRAHLIGLCLDTPNAIAKAMMENPEINYASGLLGVKSRKEYADRMKDWNVAESMFRKVE